ncbi:helix-turn-helix domain-containing protein [Kitasatospora sp. NPDC001664]
MAEARTGGDGAAVIAERLDHLFKHRHPADRGRYSIPEVAAGTGISESTLKQMKSGANTNPKINTLVALAKFFDVPPTYWTTEEAPESVFADRALQAAMRDAGVQSIALRSAALTPANKHLVAEMITMALKSQGLDVDSE